MPQANPFNPKSKNPRTALALVLAAVMLLAFALIAFIKSFSVIPSIFGGIVIAFASYLIFKQVLLRKM